MEVGGWTAGRSRRASVDGCCGCGGESAAANCDVNKLVARMGTAGRRDVPAVVLPPFWPWWVLKGRPPPWP